jgi:hypothetical protein
MAHLNILTLFLSYQNLAIPKAKYFTHFCNFLYVQAKCMEMHFTCKNVVLWGISDKIK